MTARNATLRPRRRTTVENLPKDLAAWFADEMQPKPETPAELLSAKIAFLRTLPPRSLSRLERRALGLPVEPLPPPVPWSAKLFPDYALLPERWAIWKAAHPSAKPPIGYEWLDDPSAPEQPPSWLVEQARKVAESPRRRARRSRGAAS